MIRRGDARLCTAANISEDFRSFDGVDLSFIGNVFFLMNHSFHFKRLFDSCWIIVFLLHSVFRFAVIDRE